jgi:hypothetical protein
MIKPAIPTPLPTVPSDTPIHSSSGYALAWTADSLSVGEFALREGTAVDVRSV